MVLHVFNPEHDIALAANLSNFTAPHAGRQLRSDLGMLPALWVGDSDVVLVNNTAEANMVWRRIKHRVQRGDVTFVDKTALAHMDISHVEPWGWDLALRDNLRRWGVKDDALPTDDYLKHIRSLSHRRTSAALLPLLQMKGTCGQSFECRTTDEAVALLKLNTPSVVKAPWSSSGRGVRFLSSSSLSSPVFNWLRHIVSTQGSVMVEPCYQKVKDFGMEFESTDDGIRYLGLSLFHTVNGAYAGNVLATEAWKCDKLIRYVPIDLLHAVQEKIIQSLDVGEYRGPFGVDMMICAMPEDKCYCLHPCVEINLRRTMGHVALALTPDNDDTVRVMRIKLNGHYRLSINKLRR